MPLSKEKIEQIRKDAKELAQPKLDYLLPHQEQWRKGYEAGATAWAVWKEKADGYEKALKEVYAQLDDNDIPMATRFLNAGQIIEITLNNSNK